MYELDRYGYAVHCAHRTGPSSNGKHRTSHKYDAAEPRSELLPSSLSSFQSLTHRKPILVRTPPNLFRTEASPLKPSQSRALHTSPPFLHRLLSFPTSGYQEKLLSRPSRIASHDTWPLPNARTPRHRCIAAPPSLIQPIPPPLSRKYPEIQNTGSM